MLLFSLEGNVGAGKTTFLKRLETSLDAEGISSEVVYEPVEEWMVPLTGVEEHPSLFSLYYKDKARYGFAFQMFALQTRVKRLLSALKEQKAKVIICERCHLSDYEIFGKMLRDSGAISLNEYMVYQGWVTLSAQLLDEHMKGIIYLRTTPVICIDRILIRSRPGEEQISLDYISKLHEYHERWLSTPSNCPKNMMGSPLDLCVIDGNRIPDVGQVTRMMKKWVTTTSADDLIHTRESSYNLV